ncbi:hypothetical protein PoB_000674600 [Plakobranchus ocellatus]|uniref:Uncharacterized protein n=1 Tax=Plakobranchus ocellatus TaxID=259542 RepID=A0AAV3XZ69_9GAST|nr:hypothetical protein PoB_000674600 [Plakobranchus ocellatus]
MKYFGNEKRHECADLCSQKNSCRHSIWTKENRSPKKTEHLGMEEAEAVKVCNQDFADIIERLDFVAIHCDNLNEMNTLEMKIGSKELKINYSRCLLSETRRKGHPKRRQIKGLRMKEAEAGKPCKSKSDFEITFSTIHSNHARKVQIISTAHSRPATPTVPPTPDPRCRHQRACQYKAATAIRTFKDTARPIQPFPKCYPSE